ncbi:MAG: glycoside hydrolase family 28 protein [Lachnospiraceae bacterium]|nr:glycoside hydrolase family 28 protein [Lachnospiraceae bacterium]
MEITCVYQEGNQNVIQEAIERCPDAGGTVIVPAGEWESGRLLLKSNLTLKLEEGCVIHFSEKKTDYLPVVFTRWEGVECYNYSPLIYARGCENITITGKGTLDGQGEGWWDWKKLQQGAADRLCKAESQGIRPENRVFGTEADALRPSFLQLIDCDNIVLKDFRIQDGPQWTVHPVYCRRVRIQGIHIVTHGPNTDGVNPDSCEDVRIEDCEFQTGDDCIAVNSGLNEDGWRVNRPCRQVEVCGCRFLGGHAAVAIGSGMSGGVEAVRIHDCSICGTERGVRIKSMPGRGGYVKDVSVWNLTMKEIEKEGIQVSMNYGSSTAVPVSKKAPVFSELSFRNISIQGAETGVELCGLPESPVEAELSGMEITAGTPIRKEYAKLL